MTRKLIKFFLYFVILWVLLVGLAFGGLIAWVIREPRDISAYTHYIEDSLNELSPSHKIKIEKAQISWGGFEEMLKIETKNVRLFEKSGEEVAAFPQINLDYNASYLILGELVPSTVRIINPSLDLTKMKVGQGNYVFSFDKISRLDKITVESARVILPDNMEPIKISALELLVHRHKADMKADVAIIGKPIIHMAGVVQEQGQGDYEITAQINNINSEYFRELEPRLQMVDLNGSLLLQAIVRKNKLSALGFKATNLSGKINEGEIFRATSKIKNGNITAAYNLQDKKMLLQEFAVQLENGAKFSGNGEIRAPQDMTFSVVGQNFPMVDLYKFWPKKLGENALKYARGAIKKGIVSSGSAVLNFTPEALAGDILPTNAIDLKFEFQGADLDYHSPLMPISNAAGEARMDGNSIIFEITSGNMGSSHISNASAKISKIGGAMPETIEIKGGLDGAPSDLMDFYEKLGRGKKLLKAKDISGGSAKSTAKVSFALKNDLLFDEVQYDVATKISDALVMNLFDKMSAQGLYAEAAIKNTDYNIRGSFVVTANEASKYLYIKNAPLGFAVQQRGGVAKIVVNSDLTNSNFEIADLGIKKAVGEKASLKVKITQGGGKADIESLQLDSPSFKLEASGKVSDDFSDISQITISRADFGKTSLAATIRKDKGYQANIAANVFDATKIIEKVKVSGKKDGSDQPDFAFKLTAKKMLMLNDIAAENVSLKAICPKSECTKKLSFNSSLAQIEMADGKVRIASRNAGKFLMALDSYTKMNEGDLLLTANKVNGLYIGNLRIKDFSIKKAGVLTKILTLGSLNGIADTLSGNGISFAKFDAEFEYGNDNINVKKMKMFGNAIGATAEGTIDTGLDHIALDGSIIPAYTANTLLGKIPVFGDILIGDKGVFAFAYKVKGKYSDPEVSVNPISVFAPGILKEIFQ